MVEAELSIEPLSVAIREWVAALPKDLVSLAEQDDNYERVFRLQPTNLRSSAVELRLGKHDGKLDVSVGRALQFDDLEANAETVRAVLQAARHGLIEETIITVRGRLARSRGSMRLGESIWYSNRAKLPYLLLALLGWAKPEPIRYEPF